MKYAFCILKYFPFGGRERNCLQIAEQARDRGHHIDIYCLDWQGEKPSGINIIKINGHSLTNHGCNLMFIKQVSLLIQQISYDIVVGFTMMPGLDVFYTADVCYEHHAQQNHNWLYRLLPRYKVYSALEKSIFSPQAKTHILHITDQQKQQIQYYYATPKERFSLLPPGINKDRMRPTNASTIRLQMRATLQIPVVQNVVAFIGSDFRRKGLDRALLAFAALPNKLREETWLIVIGQANAQPYQRQAHKLGILSRVKFLGATHQIPSLLLAADLLLHPAYQEAAGAVLIEAIAAGIPVLTTDNCGFAYHVNHAQAGTVISSSPYEQHQLNQQLALMLSSPQRQQWQENAIHYSKSVDLYNRAQQAVDTIEQIAAAKSQ